MENYKSITDLFKNIHKLDENEWIYTNIKTWSITPKQAVFYYIPEDFINELDDDQIFLDEEGLEMPLNTKNLELKSWMIIADLIYILEKNNGEIDRFISDVNYYREFDTFKDD